MFNKILLPYDGSSPSNKSFSYAVKFAEGIKDNLQIILLYVVPEIHLPPSYDYGLKLPYVKTAREYLKELYQSMRLNALSMLEHKKKEFETRIGTGGRITFKTQVLYGGRNTADTIIEYANNEGADLIIIGSTGLGGFAKIKALGSISRRVSERAKCPVMIIH
ncbi:MAG: universal stress protein [Nitrososphaeraceae archaeon]|jgi:nucleotide-binding universal stress UspA family protein